MRTLYAAALILVALVAASCKNRDHETPDAPAGKAPAYSSETRAIEDCRDKGAELLASCDPQRNIVIAVLATDEPTLTCFPRPPMGGLHVARCKGPYPLGDGTMREGSVVCRGSDLVPVDCTPAKAPPRRPQEAAAGSGAPQ